MEVRRRFEGNKFKVVMRRRRVSAINGRNRPPVKYNKNKFLVTKRNYNTKRRNTEVGGRGRRGAAPLSNHSLSKRS